MKKTLLPVITGLLLALVSLNTYAAIKYVKFDATGANDGSSWANAYRDLQSALNASGDTVWVANGIYKPTTTNNRDISFNISSRKLFGGFAGTETNLNDRNYGTFQTILSGDIGVVGDSTDNSNCVVKGSNCSIDGFQICKGHNENYSNGSVYGGGGGMYAFGKAYISNCHLENNYSSYYGGALMAEGSTFVDHCEFNNNTAMTGGGAAALMPGYSCGINASNSTLTGNKSLDGGAIFIGACGLIMDRCVLSGNQATNSGGAVLLVRNLFNSLNINNSLIVGNTATIYSALNVTASGLFAGNPTVTIKYSIIADNKASGGGCVNVGNNSSNNNMSGSILWNNGDGSQLSTNMISGGFSGSDNIIQTGNTFWSTNAFTFNPQFVSPGNFLNAPFNASAYDYRLQLGSQAIDTSFATISANQLTDLAGFQRGANPPWDLGCYDHCLTPVSGTIAGPSAICLGGSATLTAPSGTGFQYSWNTSATTNTITVDTTGLYILTINPGNGCTQSFQHQLSVSTPVNISGNSFLCFNSSKTLSISDNTGFYTWNTGDTTHSITVNDTGVYYVSGTSALGCLSSDTVHLMHPSQQAHVSILGDSVICPGSYDTLSAQGNLEYYFWGDPNLTIDETLIVNHGGTYHVTGFDSFGCKASDTFQVQLGVLPTPVITQNGNTLSTTTTFATYQWYKNSVAISGATQQQYAITGPGNYSVKATNSNGCEGTSAVLSVNPTTINEINKINGLSIYPNPANKYVMIDLKGMKGNIQSYSITDIWGRVVVNETTEKGNSHNTLKIDLPEVQSGSYYLKLHTTKQQYTLKLSVVK